VTLAVRATTPHPDGEPALAVGHEARVRALGAIIERYAGLDLNGFFPEPRVIDPILRDRGKLGGLTRSDAFWPSLEATFLPELSVPYRRTLQNHTAHVRLLTREKPRPLAILIHGYMLGRFSVEERVWPIARLDALGLDCALVVLPFHGVRVDPERSGRPEFPGRDPRFANEGFRQAITELRELMRWLVRRGHPAVGVMGMSLGGYTAALAATVEAELGFVVPIIPLASLADFALDHGELPEAPEPRELEHRLLEQAHEVVSPVARPPLVSRERVLVIGARADRITPLSHARRLATHFRAPLATFHGSHLVPLGRSAALEELDEMLVQLGYGRRL
jgi:pimeloyl-ACP methyl ester carboxylesterase